MRLFEPIEKSGFFWLPADVNNRLPGILRISKLGEVKLEVSGFSPDPLNPFSSRLLDAPLLGPRYKFFSRIVGIVGKNERITLEECSFVDGVSHLDGGLWGTTFRANRAFVGSIYGDRQDVTFSKINFSVEGLDEWLGISGIHTDYNWNEKRIFIDFKFPEDIALQLPDEMEMNFVFTWALSPLSSVTTEASITQKAYISLRSRELRPLDDFVDLIFKLRDFFCFAMDKTVALESITGYSKDITQSIRNGEEDKILEIPIKIYYRSLPYSEEKPKVRRFDMLFLYRRDVENELEKILEGWLKNYGNSEPAFNLYFASKSGINGYLESLFLSLIQGIETLHRRNSQETKRPNEEFEQLRNRIFENVPEDAKKWLEEKLKYANELSLRQRLRRMIKPFERFFGNKGEQDSFISKVVNTRNYLTHYDDSLARQAADENDLWMLYRKLEALFQLHFLRLVGMENESIISIVRQNTALKDKLGIEPPDLPPSPTQKM